MTMARALPSVAAMRRAIAANSVAVMVTTLALSNLVRIGSNLVLTRLLAPEAFGVVGVILTINYILTMLTDMGLNPYIVRSGEAHDRRVLDTVWTIRLLRSAALATVMFLLAGVLAEAFKKPELELPIRVASFVFLVEGLKTMRPALAIRARRVSYVFVVEFGQSLVTVLVTIAAAAILRTYWGLIVGLYAGAFAGVAASYLLYQGAPPRFFVDKEASAAVWRFSRVVAVSSAITIVLNQADKVFIGRAMDLQNFGLYMLAANLTNAAMHLVATYTARIVFPTYAETHRTAPETLPTVFYRARWRMTTALAFAFGGAIGAGPLVIRILFDDRYLGAGVYVSLLLLAPLFALVSRPAEQWSFAVGKVRRLLVANVVRLGWIAATAPLAYLQFGILGLVAAFATAEAAAAVYWWFYLVRERVFDLREEGLPAAAALVGAAIGYALYRLSESLIASGALPAF
jgi:O-antigen/teichoic acid export membrane protein